MMRWLYNVLCGCSAPSHRVESFTQTDDEAARVRMQLWDDVTEFLNEPVADVGSSSDSESSEDSHDLIVYDTAAEDTDVQDIIDQDTDGAYSTNV